MTQLLHLKLVQEVRHIKDSTTEPFSWVVNLKEVSPEANVLALIDKVEFQLHPTFNPSVEVVTKPPFKLKKRGYGSFDLTLKLYFKNKAIEPTVFVHYLDLGCPKLERVQELRLEGLAQPKKPLAEVPQAAVPKVAKIAKRSRSPSAEREVRAEKKSKLGEGTKDQNGKGIDLQVLFSTLHKLQGDDIWAVWEVIKKVKGYESVPFEPNEEFQFDLTTLEPASLSKLWEICEKYVS